MDSGRTGYIYSDEAEYLELGKSHLSARRPLEPSLALLPAAF